MLTDRVIRTLIYFLRVLLYFLCFRPSLVLITDQSSFSIIRSRDQSALMMGKLIVHFVRRE